MTQPLENGASNQPERSPASQFADSYFAAHPDRNSDPKLNTLFLNLQRGRFWEAFSMIDGNLPPFNLRGLRDREDYVKAQEEAHAWSADNFTNEELGQVLKTARHIADNPPRSGWIGNSRGNSLIYEYVIDRPESVFNQFVDDEAKKEIVNKAFWEELGLANPATERRFGMVHELLVDYGQDLEPGFAKEGVRVLKRNLPPFNQQLDITGMYDADISKYWNVVKKIAGSEEPVLENDEMLMLVRPYALASLDTIYEGEELRFGEHYDTTEQAWVKPKIDIGARLGDPLVMKFLELYPSFRADILKEIDSLCENSRDYYKQADIFDMLPEATAVLIQQEE